MDTDKFYILEVTLCVTFLCFFVFFREVSIFGSFYLPVYIFNNIKIKHFFMDLNEKN